MATAEVNQGSRERFGASRRLDRFFFPGMAILILGTVFLGFARTYYLAGVFKAPLPNWLIHVHGAAFTSWVLLLIAQTSLVAAGRVDLHRRLGLVGFGLACLMVILGVCAGTDRLRRGVADPGLDAKTSYALPIGDMAIFGPLIFFAFRARVNPPAHKRLILMATIALTPAGIGPWPFAIIHKPHMADAICYTFVLLLVIYDLWSTQKVHRATLLAGAYLIIVQQLAVPIGTTGAWHAFATWAQNLARAIHGG